MFNVELDGSYYDMGIQHGKLLKQALFNLEPFGVDNPARIELANECEVEIKKYCPGYIEHLKGIAESTTLEYNKLKVLPFCLNFLIPPIPSCTIANIPKNYTEDKNRYFMRNYDWDYNSEKVATLYHSKLKGGIENYGFCDLWGSRYGGVNKNGLCIAITGNQSYNGVPKAGISMNILVLWILDHFSTSIEAVNFLKLVPHLFAYNYLICDQAGNCRRVVTTPEIVKIEENDDEFTVQTNHFQREDMQKYVNQDFIPISSIKRFENTRQWLIENKGKITHKKIQSFMKTPTEEGGICDHGEFMGIKFGTIWGWLYDFKSKILYYTPGNPKNNAFLKIQL